MLGTGTNSLHVRGIGTNSNTCKMNYLQFFTHARGIGTNFPHMIDELVPIIHTRIPRIGRVASNKANLSNLYPGEGLF